MEKLLSCVSKFYIKTSEFIKKSKKKKEKRLVKKEITGIFKILNFNSGGIFKIIGINFENSMMLGEIFEPLEDLFHWVVDQSWLATISLIFISYFMFHIFFGTFYFFVEVIQKQTQRGVFQLFIDCFFFSVTTLEGQGSFDGIAPMTILENLVYFCSCFFGFIFKNVLFAILSAKFTTPTSLRVSHLFSQTAVIRKDPNNDNFYMFQARIVNTRATKSMELSAKICVYYIEYLKIDEIERKKKEHVIHELDFKIEDYEDSRENKLSRAKIPIPFIITHIIDQNSPIYNVIQNGKKIDEIVISIEGVDESTSQNYQSWKSYTHEEIKGGHKFKKCFFMTKDEIYVDYDLFHSTKKMENF